MFLAESYLADVVQGPSQVGSTVGRRQKINRMDPTSNFRQGRIFLGKNARLPVVSLATSADGYGANANLFCYDSTHAVRDKHDFGLRCFSSSLITPGILILGHTLLRRISGLHWISPSKASEKSWVFRKLGLLSAQSALYPKLWTRAQLNSGSRDNHSLGQ